MFRRIRAVTLLLATALGFAAATAGPVAGVSRATTTDNTTRTIKPPTTERQAKHPPHQRPRRPHPRHLQRNLLRHTPPPDLQAMRIVRRRQ